MLGSLPFTSFFILRAGAWERRDGLVAPPTHCVPQGLAPTFLILAVWLSGEQGQRKQQERKQRGSHTQECLLSRSRGDRGDLCLETTFE